MPAAARPSAEKWKCRVVGCKKKCIGTLKKLQQHVDFKHNKIYHNVCDHIDETGFKCGHKCEQSGDMETHKRNNHGGVRTETTTAALVVERPATNGFPSTGAPSAAPGTTPVPSILPRYLQFPGTFNFRPRYLEELPAPLEAADPSPYPECPAADPSPYPECPVQGGMPHSPTTEPTWFACLVDGCNASRCERHDLQDHVDYTHNGIYHNVCDHIDEKTGVNCGYKYETRSELNRHKRDHKCTKCTECTATFKAKQELDRHYVTSHSPPDNPARTEYKCEVCQKGFSTSSACNAHFLRNCVPKDDPRRLALLDQAKKRARAYRAR
jgi:hypothetical protein